MLFNKSHESGFIQVQNFDTNTTIGDLTRMWCHSSGGNTLSSITVTFYRAPELLFNYITPLLKVVPVSPTKPYIYPYLDVTRYPTDNGSSTAGGASGTINSNNIQLNSVPTKILICIRQSNSGQSYLTTDSFARIDSLSINYQNQSGLLSSATTEDLYLMSVKNGLKMSWPQYSQYVGSVVSVEFGSDIGLDNSSPGMLENAQLQMQVNFTNIGSVTKNYTLYIIVLSEGSFTLTGALAVPQVGILSKNDVASVNQNNLVDFSVVAAHRDWEGGDFWGSFKRVLGQVLPLAGPVGTAAKGVLGLGVSGGRRRKRIMSRPKLGMRLKRSRMMGNGLVSSNELRDRLDAANDDNVTSIDIDESQ
jgi:hypothetical protein